MLLQSGEASPLHKHVAKRFPQCAVNDTVSMSTGIRGQDTTVQCLLECEEGEEIRKVTAGIICSLLGFLSLCQILFNSQVPPLEQNPAMFYSQANCFVRNTSERKEFLDLVICSYSLQLEAHKNIQDSSFIYS